MLCGLAVIALFTAHGLVDRIHAVPIDARLSRILIIVGEVGRLLGARPDADAGYG